MSVRLTDDRLTHILKHPEMEGLEGAIEATLAHSERVVESLNDPQARPYYRFYVGGSNALNLASFHQIISTHGE